MKILPSDISINMIILMNILNNISLIWNRFWNPVVGFFYRTYLVWELLRTPKIVYPYIGKTFTETFPPEIITLMLSHIKRNQDKCRFLITCQGIMKCDFTFDEEVRISKIEKSRWYDKFTKIGIYYGDEWPSQFPLSIKHLVYLPLLDWDKNYHHSKLSRKNYTYYKLLRKIGCVDDPQSILPLSVTNLTINNFNDLMIEDNVVQRIISVDTGYIYTNAEPDGLFNLLSWKRSINILHITLGKEINKSIANISIPNHLGLKNLLLSCQINQMIEGMNDISDKLNAVIKSD